VRSQYSSSLAGSLRGMPAHPIGARKRALASDPEGTRACPTFQQLQTAE
jgi:hypothetical protein